MGYVFGGGLIATHLKHDALDESENYLHNAQIALQRFQNELLDVQDMSTKSLAVETDGFVKFADYFFDDIFQLGLSILKYLPLESRFLVYKMMSIIRSCVYRINIIRRMTICSPYIKKQKRSFKVICEKTFPFNGKLVIT